MASAAADPDILQLASAIASGEPVDWGSADVTVTSPELLSALRTIDAVAALAGRIPDRWGRLQIRGELGRGAHGVVYAAHEPQLKKDMALKVVRLRDDSAVDAALKEAQLLAHVNHRNVVRVFWAEVVDGEVGLAMELVPGHTLSELLRTRGPLDVLDAMRIGLDVCRGLNAVHGAGLLHGDVKAGNVIRTADGRTVLLDFGVAQALHDGESSGSRVAGTPLYLAPELFRGEPRSCRTDIYSIGVLLYHLVTNAYPIDARDAADVERHHAERRPIRSLRQRRPDLPKRFVAVVDRAMAANPGDRFATVAELAAALDQTIRSAEPRPALRYVVAGVAAVAVIALALTARRDTARRAPLVTSAADVQTAASSPTAAPFTSDYRVDVALYRHEGKADVRLAPGARVSLGDALSMRVSTSVPTYVYVVNEDDRDAGYLLFPHPGQALPTPLPAGHQHQLPGVVDGQRVYWTVNSVGGREHFVVMVTPDPPSPAFERMFKSLPSPVLGAGVFAHPLSGDDRTVLRGVGGLMRAPGQATQLSKTFGVPLPEGEQTARGIWVRQLTLESADK